MKLHIISMIRPCNKTWSWMHMKFWVDRRTESRIIQEFLNATLFTLVIYPSWDILVIINHICNAQTIFSNVCLSMNLSMVFVSQILCLSLNYTIFEVVSNKNKKIKLCLSEYTVKYQKKKKEFHWRVSITCNNNDLFCNIYFMLSSYIKSSLVLR